MKTSGNAKNIVIGILAAVFIQGCAKQKAVSTAPGANTSGDQTGGGLGTDPGSPGSGSNKIVFSNFNAAAFRAFMAPRLASAGITDTSSVQPQDVSLDLFAASSDTYGGEVKFNFLNNGSPYNMRLQSTGFRMEGGKCKFFGSTSTGAKYNKSYTKDGKEVWHGFFQDCWGSIVVILDGYTEVSLGDGDRQRIYNGSIYFKNFEVTPLYNDQGNLACWDITVGPYDCRTFLESLPTGTYNAELAKSHPGIAYGVNPTNELYPNFTFTSNVSGYSRTSYTKMGQFTNLDYNSVFGN